MKKVDRMRRTREIIKRRREKKKGRVNGTRGNKVKDREIIRKERRKEGR